MRNIEKILRQVEKPARYLGGEWNEIKKNPQKVKAKIALVFPEVYEVGMSYLGQKILYHLINSHPSFLAERVFSPWLDFEEKLRFQNIPLFSLENKIPLSEFDILGFSLLFELNYSNILTILELGKIPLFSRNRDPHHHPLVIAGGPAAFNPEPVADIFDLFLIGDGEEGFLEIIQKFITLRHEIKGKEEILRELRKIKGVYVPHFYQAIPVENSPLLAVKPRDGARKKIQKRVFFSFSQFPFPEKIIVPNQRTVFERVVIEVERGCAQKCRFCQASSIYFPPRVKNPALVLENTLNSLRSTGFEDASLASLSVSDYPYLEEVVQALMKHFEKEKISLSLSAMRPAGLSKCLAENIVKVRKTGFTIVPEAGTERLRRVINKNLHDEEIWEACRNAFLQGWRLLKMYFMIGLPTEKEEDLRGIVRTVEEIIKIGYRYLRSAPQINLSVSSFIPKPHTPFQWLKMEEEESLREKQRFLQSCLRRYPSVKIKAHQIETSILEATFSRGDRRLSAVLEEAWRRGARFDSWDECFDYKVWNEAFETQGVDKKIYLSALEREAILPWEHIDTGIKKSYLLQELEKAFKEERTISCRDYDCERCAGCIYRKFLERDFSRDLNLNLKETHFLGKRGEREVRYLAFYSKSRVASYLSQVDLINVIKRSFRRAGISVVHSKGYHPKMRISFPPALPLGMEGKKEVFEFRSEFVFDKNEFKERMNEYLPSGIRFLELIRMKDSSPPLKRMIEGLIYSLDFKNEEVREVLREKIGRMRIESGEEFRALKEIFEASTPFWKELGVKKICLDEEGRKVYFHLEYNPQRAPRIQDVVHKIFQVSVPVFLMAREEIQLSREAYELTELADLSIKFD